jgi:hypothetical protein
VADCAADARRTLPQNAILIQSLIACVAGSLGRSCPGLRLPLGSPIRCIRMCSMHSHVKVVGPARAAAAARDFVPWIPDSMHRYAKRLTYTLTGNVELPLIFQLLAYRNHAPMDLSGGKHQMQGVWGPACPPSGEREGQSPLAIAKQQIALRQALRAEGLGAGCALKWEHESAARYLSA